jgi:hypothetical protein
MLSSGTPTLSASATERASDVSAAKSWRHLVLEIDVPEDEERAQTIQDRLDQVAAQGWELVAMTSVMTYLPAPGGMESLGARVTLLAAFKRSDQA